MVDRSKEGRRGEDKREERRNAGVRFQFSVVHIHNKISSTHKKCVCEAFLHLFLLAAFQKPAA